MKKRTIRKVWDYVNPLTHAMYQASKLTIKEWNAQIIPVQVAVDRLSTGDWNDYECWQPVFECLNRVESLVKLHKVDDVGFIVDAQTAIVHALERKEKTGVQAFKAQELSMLRELVATYGSLLKEVSHGQFAKACAHTNANVDRILKNKHKMEIHGGCIFEMKSA